MAMYYLRPRPTGRVFGMNGLRPDLPLVMLWGDYHRDDTGMCVNCDCKSPKEGCCHTIYDTEFLKKLDEMAEDHPIDFYTEFSKELADLRVSNSNILFKRFLQNTTAKCHKKELRSQKEYNDCPTTFMRWHYTDVRFMKHTIESYLTNNTLEKIEEELTSFNRDFSGIMKITEQEDKKQHYDIFEDYINGIKHNFINEIPSINNSYKGLYEDGSKLLLDVIELVTTPYSNFEEKTSEENIRMKYKHIFSKWVDAVSDSKKSIFYKQLTKIGIPHILNKDWLVTFLTDSFLYLHFDESLKDKNDLSLHEQEYDINRMDVNYGKLIHSIFLSVREKIVSNVDRKAPWSTFLHNILDQPTYNYEEANTKLLSLTSVLKHILLCLNGVWVELYMLARMLKPPQDNSPPLLSLGFFGNTHSLRLVHLLTYSRYFDYELVYYHVNDETRPFPPFRCIRIEKPIYLYEDLLRHAKSQYAYRNKMGYIEAYEKVKLQEKRGRENKGRENKVELQQEKMENTVKKNNNKNNNNKPLLDITNFIKKGGKKRSNTRKTRKYKK
jgi:hypothetical protein